MNLHCYQEFCIKKYTSCCQDENLLCKLPNPAGLAQSNLASRLPGLEGTWHIQVEINMSSSLSHSWDGHQGDHPPENPFGLDYWLFWLHIHTADQIVPLPSATSATSPHPTPFFFALDILFWKGDKLVWCLLWNRWCTCCPCLLCMSCHNLNPCQLLWPIHCQLCNTITALVVGFDSLSSISNMSYPFTATTVGSHRSDGYHLCPLKPSSCLALNPPCWSCALPTAPCDIVT